MDIPPIKYSLGQKLWVMANNRLIEAECSTIFLRIDYKPGEWALTNEPQFRVTYHLGAHGNYEESSVFASKTELLASL